MAEEQKPTKKSRSNTLRARNPATKANPKGAGRPKGSKNKDRKLIIIPGGPLCGDSGQGLVSPDESVKMVQAIEAFQEIRKCADVNNIDSLYSCLAQYLNVCEIGKVKVTNGGAYMCCGVNKALLESWISGKSRSGQPAYKEFATHLLDICMVYREMMMAEGKLNPVLGIWWQKVYEHYTDMPQADLRIIEKEKRSSDDIAAAYKDLL